NISRSRRIFFARAKISGHQANTSGLAEGLASPRSSSSELSDLSTELRESVGAEAEDGSGDPSSLHLCECTPVRREEYAKRRNNSRATIHAMAVAKSQSKTFQGTLERFRANGLNWVITRIPFSVQKLWGTRGSLKVFVEVNGFKYRTSLFPTGRG